MLPGLGFEADAFSIEASRIY